MDIFFGLNPVLISRSNLEVKSVIYNKKIPFECMLYKIEICKWKVVTKVVIHEMAALFVPVEITYVCVQKLSSANFRFTLWKLSRLTVLILIKWTLEHLWIFLSQSRMILGGSNKSKSFVDFPYNFIGVCCFEIGLIVYKLWSPQF